MLDELKAQGIDVFPEGADLRVLLSGEWLIFGDRPGIDEVLSAADVPETVTALVVDCSGVTRWDSQLLLFLLNARVLCRRRAWEFRAEDLPEGLGKLLEQVPDPEGQTAPERKGNFLARTGDLSKKWAEGATDIFQFTGELVASTGRVLRHPRRFRWGDCFEAMQQSGAMALPIVGLISFLVGVIMAFQAAIQLRLFGAEIFVADLVGLAVVREMGPMMAAVVLCGRTGAAFAAQIGTMKVNEEIDALRTLGTSPIDFLVMPRMVALFIMMPLLAVYADFLGILGGLFIGLTSMDMTPAGYLAQTREAITLTDASTGVIKAVAFGWLIAFSGCLRGLQCKRSSAGVGAAATSAVVTGILLVIVADALFAVIFDRLGI